ncbi:carbohydrate-binding protein [Actinocorallia populi]|uniref:carbohydrate-binding protein n=1 Tax=Actinocorallia populi TaxID=2079200 RepID=UPI000D08E44A|nr:carbohydrate-binding protein [Actinocorallia populi]
MKGLLALFAGRDRYHYMIASGLAFGLLAGVLGVWGVFTRDDGILQFKFRTVAAPDDGWKVLFEDGFDGEANADPGDHWLPDIGHHTVSPLGGQGPMNFGTTEIARMTDDRANYALDGEGNLAITPRRSEAGEWTSARINSEQVFKTADGGQLAFEARIQMPQVTGEKALGYWPAFWLLNQEQRLHPEGENWPSGGEIDIVEGVNGLNLAHTTLHCGVKGGGDQGGPCNEHTGRGVATACTPVSCQDGPHVYRLEFDRRTDAEELRWYLDGKLVHRLSREEAPDGADGDQWRQAWDNLNAGEGFFMILNIAIGGDMPRGNGGDVSPATEPGHPMLIDYVKVMARGAGAPETDVDAADPDGGEPTASPSAPASPSASPSDAPSASPSDSPSASPSDSPEPAGSPTESAAPTPSPSAGKPDKSAAPWSPVLTQAEGYSDQSGVKVDTAEDIGGTEYIGWLADGDRVSYDEVDFGPAGPKKLIARVASDSGEGKIEVRLGSPDTAPLATVAVPDTGGWQDWEDVIVPLPDTAGRHTVHLKFVSPQEEEFLNINWFILLP